MSDEEQIRAMQALWGQRHADRDAEGWSQLFTENGTYINPRRQSFVGRAAIRAYLEERYAGHAADRHIRHVFGEPLISIQADIAEMSADYASIQCNGAEPAFIGAMGRHSSRLIRQDGRWLFEEYRIVNPYE